MNSDIYDLPIEDFNDTVPIWHTLPDNNTIDLNTEEVYTEHLNNPEMPETTAGNENENDNMSTLHENDLDDHDNNNNNENENEQSVNMDYSPSVDLTTTETLSPNTCSLLKPTCGPSVNEPSALNEPSVNEPLIMNELLLTNESLTPGYDAKIIHPASLPSNGMTRKSPDIFEEFVRDFIILPNNHKMPGPNHILDDVNYEKIEGTTRSSARLVTNCR